ncbi:MAG: FtsW/RodA/SpoVE family cell cycle protein [Clostridia bacterium]|jgi:cell division protein FtsW (lipid II flippase)|nr:FtsW/RodA/SpoVE family cell cycle protein [Clostridia bacterium]MCI2000208.1 FtsW/RodA/SpoVE family cell cycle protein [Clostridia bacterium]MCI2014627.1 FtsW/RodA/SpoVE family cell cycle protein [Clostridia bacterium]
MFDLLIIISRYLFIGYILIFLFSSAEYLLDEAGMTKHSHRHAVFTGRTVTALMHITAFLIISYNREEINFNLLHLAVGGVGLAAIIGGNYIAQKVYKNGCPLIWNCIIFLLDTGIIMLMRLNDTLAVRQLIWIGVGFLTAFWIPAVIKLVPKFEKFEKLYIILSFILIISTLALGSKEYGSINWIHIGNFSFQPSEIVKFLYIFYLASVFRKKVDLKKLIITCILSAGLVMLLVIQKDLGSALIFFMTYMVMLYIATSNEFLAVLGIGAASIGSMFAYKLFSHVRVRVAAWKNPWADIDSGGYQICQSLFAIGTGGMLGSGLTRGMPTSIPVVTKDFIFSAICEEFGTIYAVCLIGIFMILFIRGMMIAFKCKRRYYSFLAAGFTAMMAFQTFLIIGGVIKLIPLTGVTLPFISYGGTSILVSIMSLSFIQWVNGYQKAEEMEEQYDGKQ